MDQTLLNRDFVKGEILLFDKPLDWTSFDVVNRVRYLLCRKLKIKKLKVGHAGTLDPKATGLVVLCTGKATKQIESLQAEEKEYIATLKLGATTPSFDLESEEDQSFETKHITLELINEKLKQFIGEIDQVPPVFSAIKVNGKRAFDYARGGHDLELKARKIWIGAIEILDFNMPELCIKITCGKGTYVRSLARDIGESLGSGAYLTALRRTRVGDNKTENAFSIEEFEKNIEDL
ncbi:MAG: tRNA pseudouridine(55) synthase TruB [Prolixibacteraceae bacterium]|jgi:tRNA pseudouridine55 synthase|nr:tRNA pseudouridine(55) synthase TruB [Prolixibacteraceae bacterium]